MSTAGSKQVPVPAKEFCLIQGLDVSGLLVGIDEVGRGPLVGAVVAAAVILPENHGILGLRDSKKISEKKRQSLSIEIKEKALAWSLGRCEASEIDEHNILQASLLAMQRAVEALTLRPDFALVDGNKKPALSCGSLCVVKGDSRVEEISAASIVAKVHRDEEMERLHEYYPEYGFASHKGYPTAQHLEALSRHGVTPQHRKSYGPVRRILELASQQES